MPENRNNYNNQIIAIMKKKNYQGEAAYSAPAAALLEVSSEGILCASFGNEGFDSNGPTYGEGQDNNGWN